MSCNEQVLKLAKRNEMVMDSVLSDHLQCIVEKQRVLSLALSGLSDPGLMESECMGLVKLADEVADALQKVIDDNDHAALKLAEAV